MTGQHADGCMGTVKHMELLRSSWRLEAETKEGHGLVGL